ncbi:helix-turn-helix domain-containing protein [Abyssalbus ytuae]|uniref:AraC family transcriptional regulator n=1 Tax=Abyssalbus ytuae TaxID=2926907 RepID=A0A9E7CTU8_9FLAO|nr:AraC family transcriptional regulator [Abyssalbus ytuae]UOB16857.1 AraC family transcriptional regulator [Abyssalbus ytuae]
MESVLKSTIFKENTLIKTYTKDFKTTILQENVKEVNSNGIKGLIKGIQLDGVYINVHDIYVEDSYYMDVVHDFPFFKLHFEIQGSSNYTPHNTLSLPVYIPDGHFNLFYFPEVKGRLSYETTRRKTLEIKFTERYIKKIIGKDFKNVLSEFGQSVLKRKPYKMWNDSIPISVDLQIIINKIISCNYPPDIKKAFLESQVTELLTILFAKIVSKDIENNIRQLAREELMKIKKVETYIKQNIRKKITISELASVGGLNTSKLKYDFKRVFSTTIFKYITKLRMEEAQKLIIDHNYTITQASYEVGYKNPQHFTVAFKKMYGYLPSDLNKLKLV